MIQMQNESNKQTWYNTDESEVQRNKMGWGQTVGICEFLDSTSTSFITGNLCDSWDCTTGSTTRKEAVWHSNIQWQNLLTSIEACKPKSEIYN